MWNPYKNEKFPPKEIILEETNVMFTATHNHSCGHLLSLTFPSIIEHENYRKFIRGKQDGLCTKCYAEYCGKLKKEGKTHVA